MSPKKGTKAYRDEIVRVFYGINPKTLRVESVSMSRDRDLSAFRSDTDLFFTHYVMPGRDPKAEVSLVFGLTDIIEIMAALDTPDHYAKKQLEEKAASMRGDQNDDR